MKKSALFVTIFTLVSIQAICQIASEDIKIDLRLTGFKFAQKMDDMLVFLPNGKQDLTIKGDPSSFSIHTEPRMDFERSVGYIEFQMDYARRHGATISNIKKTDTVLNGNRTYEVTFTERIKEAGISRLNYYAIALKGTTAIIFLSGDSTMGKYIEQLKKTFRTAKI